MGKIGKREKKNKVNCGKCHNFHSIRNVVSRSCQNFGDLKYHIDCIKCEVIINFENILGAILVVN